MANKPITQRVNGDITPKKSVGPGGPDTPAPAPKPKAAGMNPPSYVYIVGEEGKRNREVSKAEYDRWKGPKTYMRKGSPGLETLGTGRSNVQRGYIKKS
jgi:hypothetical protein